MKVKITCSQTLHFEKEIEVTEEDYESLMEVPGDLVSERSYAEAFYIINSAINTDDIVDAENEFSNFQVTDVDE